VRPHDRARGGLAGPIQSIAKGRGHCRLERRKTVSDAWPTTRPRFAAEPRQLLIRIASHERDEGPRAGRCFEDERHLVRDDEVGMGKRFGELSRVLGGIGFRSRDHDFRQLVLLPLLNTSRGRPVDNHRRTTQARVSTGTKTLEAFTHGCRTTWP
jgi:hypothetical protein